jgi:hypothetical protein
MNGNTCNDGKDNDCDGLIDSQEPDCPENSMNFTGNLTYSNGLPVANSLIRVIVNNTAFNFEKSAYNQTDSNGHFFVKVTNLPYFMRNSDFDLSIYVVGEVEAIYQCHYDSSPGVEHCYPV